MIGNYNFHLKLALFASSEKQNRIKCIGNRSHVGLTFHFGIEISATTSFRPYFTLGLHLPGVGRLASYYVSTTPEQEPGYLSVILNR